VRLLRRLADKNEWTDTGAAAAAKLGAARPTDGQDRSTGLQSVSVQHEADRPGEFVFKAVVDALAGEENAADNSAEVAVKISEEKLKVLLISGDAGWEFQYLKNHLLRQVELYRVSVWQQNSSEEANQAASTGMKLSRLPRSLPELVGSPGGKPHPGYDVVILYDPQPTEGGFDAVFAKELLSPFVKTHGGGLCYIAGNKYSGAALVEGRTFRPLANLLPVRLAPNRINLAARIGQEKPQPWPVRLTSYGVDHPVTRLAGTADDNRDVWGVLPGIYWSHPVSKIKPGARSLAESSNPLRRTRGERVEPLVASQPVGIGRVVYVGFDGTWRWRFVRQGYYHRLFWSNVIHYLASLKARQIVITAGGDRFTIGERITVEVEAYDDDFRPLVAETFDVTMANVDNDDDRRTIRLKPVGAKDFPGRYKGTIVAARTGKYELTALAGDPMAAEKVAAKSLVIELPQAEARRTEADLATLKRICRRQEDFVRLADVDKLAGRIPPGRLNTVREVPRSFWDSKFALALIVALLVAEWIGRKKYNMA